MHQTNRKRTSILVGPWGGNVGDSWDDGSIYHGVREITLAYGSCIDSIHVVYDNNGKPVTVNKHGGTGGDGTVKITLDYPEEFLVSLRGYYGNHRNSTVIKSLMFKSNRRTYGPFGREGGTPFKLTIESGSVVGFMGRSGWYIDSIGFYISHPPLPPPPPPPPATSATTPKRLQAFQRKLHRLATTGSK
ncbi:hypothetical protein K2173_024409 [Erythroxylum novogranatense]|uniref:Jacalin-type lectin domain-containing protein n=1 Tax=Erythroxylum novogranatense TaxID=1862640 RepID=A0AAV8SVH8_9ROSI|nr:hypothetical protein K2173_024409 [Erythroxylum novogranatense]